MNFLSDANKYKIFFLDLPKMEPLPPKAYTFLEEMKNGKVTIKKTSGNSFFKEVGERVQIVMFSNKDPEKKALSQDRFVIFDPKLGPSDINQYTRWKLTKRREDVPL